MRVITSAVVLMMVLVGAHAQSDIWKEVKTEFDSPHLRSVTPSAAHLKAITALLRRGDKDGEWECEGHAREKMIQGLTYKAIPIAENQQVILAEAGAGCARGGQGSNGAMWLIRFDGARAVLMASPKGGFGGWLYSIQPTTSHGYRDIVLGWHMSAFESELTYFRFDGRSYASVGRATRTEDDNDQVSIVPNAR